MEERDEILDQLKANVKRRPTTKAGKAVAHTKLDLGLLKKDTASWRTVQVKYSLYTEFERLAKENDLPVGRVINAVLDDFLKK